jgi:hypothetical protein
MAIDNARLTDFRGREPGVEGADDGVDRDDWGFRDGVEASVVYVAKSRRRGVGEQRALELVAQDERRLVGKR